MVMSGCGHRFESLWLHLFARLMTGGDCHGCHGPRADRQLQGGVRLKARRVVLFFAGEVLMMLEGGWIHPR